MKTICVIADACIDNAVIHHRLDEIAERIPCFASYSNGEIVVKCRIEDAAFVERKLADLV